MVLAHSISHSSTITRQYKVQKDRIRSHWCTPSPPNAIVMQGVQRSVASCDRHDNFIRSCRMSRGLPPSQATHIQQSPHSPVEGKLSESTRHKPPTSTPPTSRAVCVDEWHGDADKLLSQQTKQRGTRENAVTRFTCCSPARSGPS